MQSDSHCFMCLILECSRDLEVFVVPWFLGIEAAVRPVTASCYFFVYISGRPFLCGMLWELFIYGIYEQIT